MEAFFETVALDVLDETVLDILRVDSSQRFIEGAATLVTRGSRLLLFDFFFLLFAIRLDLLDLRQAANHRVVLDSD